MKKQYTKPAQTIYHVSRQSILADSNQKSYTPSDDGGGVQTAGTREYRGTSAWNEGW